MEAFLAGVEEEIQKSKTEESPQKKKQRELFQKWNNRTVPPNLREQFSTLFQRASSSSSSADTDDVVISSEFINTVTTMELTNEKGKPLLNSFRGRNWS